MSRRWRIAWKLYQRIRERNQAQKLVQALQTAVLESEHTSPMEFLLTNQADLLMLSEAMPIYRRLDDEVRALMLPYFRRRFKRKPPCPSLV